MDVRVVLEKIRRIIRHFELRAKRAKTATEARRAIRLLRFNLNRIRIDKEFSGEYVNIKAPE